MNVQFTTGSKSFTFGKVSAERDNSKTNLVELEITLKLNRSGLPVFTSSANVWNNKHSAMIQCGQCLDSIYANHSKELQNKAVYTTILGLWERNHLNDMNAGTAEQTDAIKAWGAAGNRYEYTAVCDYLKSINLYEVEHEGKPYKYGNGWIYREISNEDLEAIQTLLAD